MDGEAPAGDPDLTIVTYTCEPASPTEQALALLASWSTNQDTNRDSAASPTPIPSNPVAYFDTRDPEEKP